LFDLEGARDKFAVPPEAIARAIVFAIEQPADVDVGEIIVRPRAELTLSPNEMMQLPLADILPHPNL
jgi:hypothetical protein